MLYALAYLTLGALAGLAFCAVGRDWRSWCLVVLTMAVTWPIFAVLAGYLLACRLRRAQ